MSDASGFLALGQALDDYLVGEYAPPPGTQTALAFLAGVPVDPSAFEVGGVVNPARVNEFVNIVANQVAPVVDGRFAGGMMAADQLFGAVLSLSAPIGVASPAGNGFASMKSGAAAAFGTPSTPQYLAAAPSDWYDGDGWSRFSRGASSASGSSEGSSAGETPPIIGPHDRFERLWRWRSLDPSTMADVVAPAALGPAGPLKIRSELLARRMQGSVVVHDHRTTALRAEAVLDHRALGARPPELRVMTRAPLLQLTNLVDAESLLASGGDAAMKSQAVAQQLDEKVPVLEAALDGDGEAHSTQSVESDELTLSLDYCVVQLSRAPWWNDLLLRMPGWYIPGLRAGAFVPSSRLEGQPVGVPIAMVVTRNVQVTGRWSQADRTAAESHTSFGPWHIGETSLSFDQSEVQATLRIDGMQVIAVICSLLPAIPPADDPALAQPASPAAS